MAKLKATGISRILLFLIVLLPALFFGVSYAKGEDPMANLRSLFGMEANANEDATKLDDVADLQKALKTAKAENETLRRKLEACEDKK